MVLGCQGSHSHNIIVVVFVHVFLLDVSIGGVEGVSCDCLLTPPRDTSIQWGKQSWVRAGLDSLCRPCFEQQMQHMFRTSSSDALVTIVASIECSNARALLAMHHLLL